MNPNLKQQLIQLVDYFKKESLPKVLEIFIDENFEEKKIVENNPVLVEDEYITIKDDGRKTSEIMAECRSLFEVYSYYNDKELDKQFKPVTSERKFRYLQEADPENANKSANDLEKEGIMGITLRERLLFELAYFKKTGNHLDIENATLCTGSRLSGGGVPYVYWLAGRRKLCVSWYYPDHANGRWRARSVVSSS